MMQFYLDFEKNIAALEAQIEELRSTVTDNDSMDIENNIVQIEKKIQLELKKLYSDLDPWQKTQVARHPARPHVINYIEELVDDFTLLAGDRLFSEDKAIIGGIGRWHGRPVAIIGHEKGFDTETRLIHNFGMARPEGYRKAIRIMKMAEQFQLPLVTLIDTSGAYPGIGAEERGQAEAIARCTDQSLQLSVPFVSVIIGEGGSGGAVALASANSILMLEHSIYAVASPEACASILWRSKDYTKDAARALGVTAQSLVKLKVIDHVLSEPLGGAHRQPTTMIKKVGIAVDKELNKLGQLSAKSLLEARRDKFLAMGRVL